MPKNHARKKDARDRQRSTGAAYTSAAAGTAHDHGGPPIEPVDGRIYGVDRDADMTTASALIGACVQGCMACQRSLAAHVLDGDRLVIADLARDIYKRLPPAAGITSTLASKAVNPLIVASLTSGDGRDLLAAVEALDKLAAEDLLEDTLDLWTALEAMTGAGDTDPEGDQGPDGDGEPKPARVAGSRWSCAYMMSAGMDQYLTDEDMGGLAEFAERSGGGGDRISCHLCDNDIDVITETEAHVGLVLVPAAQHGAPDVCMPVWTHPGCGKARIWTFATLEAERRRRGLPVTGPGPSRSDPGPAGEAAADFTGFSLAQLKGGVYPLLVIQPGRPHEHGVDAHLADLVSMGLGPVDLSDEQQPAELAGWQVRVDRGRLTALTRSGAGAWYRQEGGYPAPGEWRQAARRQRAVLVLIVPAGTIPDGDADFRPALAGAADAGRVLGGLMSLRGTLS